MNERNAATGTAARTIDAVKVYGSGTTEVTALDHVDVELDRVVALREERDLAELRPRHAERVHDRPAVRLRVGRDRRSALSAGS